MSLLKSKTERRVLKRLNIKAEKAKRAIDKLHKHRIDEESGKLPRMYKETTDIVDDHTYKSVGKAME